MRPSELPLPGMVRVLRDPARSHVLDIELGGLDRLRALQSLECHVVLYPYSRAIDSSRFEFHPFEEYVDDIATHKRSAYTERQSFGGVFGLLLGVAIACVFAWIRPDQLLAVDAVVSVLGAYLIGRDLWPDVERLLIETTARRRLRFRERVYAYRLEKGTTLTSYSVLARTRRYGRHAILPERLDMIEKSNSQTVRMDFRMRDIIAPRQTTQAHVLSIHLDPEIVEAFDGEGYMLGVKLSFNRRIGPLLRSFEVFQSLERERTGCLHGDAWVEGALFTRRTLSLGRLKFFVTSGVIEGVRLFSEDAPAAPAAPA